ncbi:Imm53 family immunity protein [Brevibacillus brevis]|nr:Imm53 family immunity protein [Brevibacillus brevis]
MSTDWEHGYEITICTIDNPGWSIRGIWWSKKPE